MRGLIASIGAVAVALVGCADDGTLRERIEQAGVYSPARDDHVSPLIADLGQLLFFDPELSGNRNVACSSCHLPLDHAGDRQALGLGQGGTGAGSEREGGPELPRNTISPFNRSFAEALLWDGRVERLADGSIAAPVPLPAGIDSLLQAQALLPLLDRDEMRGHPGDLDVRGAENELAAIADDDPAAVWDAIMARLMSIEVYRVVFAAAFPEVAEGEHTIVHLVRAIERFEMRLWELTDTGFDRFIGSASRTPDDTALDAEARRGAELFFGDAGCARCHDGPLLSDDGFHNIGAPPFGPGKVDGVDEGRFLVTGDPSDRFAFRTPPLRNVALTAPYMHDGSIATLSEAIELHLAPERALDAGSFVAPDRTTVAIDPALAARIRETIDPDVRPLRELTTQEIGDLVRFLHALSSAVEEFGLPPHAGEPESVPSGLPVPRSSDERFER